MTVTAALRRRRVIVAGTAVVGTGLLGMSLSTEPDSPEFYALTLGVASVWTLGGLGSGPLHLRASTAETTIDRPLATSALIGAGAFAAFYAGALAARRIPVLNQAITSIFQYAHQGSDPLVMLTALANGAAEEVFFRGALYSAAEAAHPVAVSTAGYVLATTATRNPALVLASAAMGSVFAWQRRRSGGVLAPIVSHLTWSALMLRYVPPLFDRSTTGSGSRLRPRMDRRTPGCTDVNTGAC